MITVRSEWPQRASAKSQNIEQKQNPYILSAWYILGTVLWFKKKGKQEGKHDYEGEIKVDFTYN